VRRLLRDCDPARFDTEITTMKRLSIATMLLSLTIIAPTHGANYAFLVACSEYQRAPFAKLPNAFDETEAFRQALIATEFPETNIVFLHNGRTDNAGKFLPTRDAIRDELDALVQRLTDQDTLIVLFNGHGAEFNDDLTSYFCPIDARRERRDSLIPLDGPNGVFTLVRKYSIGRKLVFVNNCRNDFSDQVTVIVHPKELEEQKRKTLPVGVSGLWCNSRLVGYTYPPEANIARSVFMNHLVESWKGTYSGSRQVTIDDVFRFVKQNCSADASKYFDRPSFVLHDRPAPANWVIGQAPTKAMLAFRRGKQAFDVHKYQQTIDAMTEAIQLDPKFGDAFTYRAWARLGRGKKIEALSDAEEGVRLAPKSARAWAIRAFAHDTGRNYAQSLLDCQKAIEIDPKLSIAYSIQCLSLGNLGRNDEAIRSGTKAIELDPKSPLAWTSRSRAYNSNRDFDKSIADANQSVNLDPKRPSTYTNRGKVFLDHGKVKEAITDFTKAIELDPGSAVTFNNRGSAHGRLKKLDLAMEDFTESLRIDPTYAPAYINRGMLQKSQGKLDLAMSDLSKAIEHDPTFVEAYVGRADVKLQKGDAQGSIDDLDIAIRLRPKNADAFVNRGAAHHQLKNSPAAIADFTKAIELNEKEYDAYYNRAIVYLNTREFDKAIDDCTKAIAIEPGIARFYDLRAGAYTLRGQVGDAERAEADKAKAMKLKEGA